MTKLIETTFSAGAKVDRDAKIIHGVKVIGKDSQNGRTYSDDALKQLAGLYEGMQVNLDHPERQNATATRSIADGFGILRSPKIGTDGVYADLHYLESHTQAPMLLERAERMPNSFGLSHNAEGKTKKRNGRVVVESVDTVYSVDIVSSPATTAGLFESVTQEVKTVKRTAKQISESAPENTSGLVLLREMLDAGQIAPDMPVDVPEAAAPGDAIKEAFKQAVIAAFDDESLDTAATIAKIRDILKAQEKVVGGGSPKDETPSDTTPSDMPSDVAESIRAVQSEMNEIKAKNMLLESNRDASPERVAAVAAIPEKGRQKLVESWPAKAEKLAGAPRPGRSQPLRESRDGAKVRWDKAVERAEQKLSQR